jgi:hypothetical protein
MAIYNSIGELPLKIFDKITTSGNIKLLVIDGEYSEIEIITAWDTINREFYNEFGISFNEKEELKAKIRYITHMKNYFINNDLFSKTLADLEKEKQKINKSKGTTSYLKMCVLLNRNTYIRTLFSRH